MRPGSHKGGSGMWANLGIRMGVRRPLGPPCKSSRQRLCLPRGQSAEKGVTSPGGVVSWHLVEGL